jgi:hypothetical protein
LINIAEPDPQYQPLILTDEASLLDVSTASEDDLLARFRVYFGDEINQDLLRLPIWRLVDRIRTLRPGWPEDDPN